MLSYSCVLVVLVFLFGAFVPRAQGQAIQSIEVNQAIGVQKNGNLKFVAGKDTVIRAFMAAPVAIDAAQTLATVVRDGVVVATLAPNATDGETAVVDFLCPSRATCGYWAAGSYVFDVQVNGQTSSTAGTAYPFVERGKLRVLALPVKTNYNGTVLSVANDSWKTLWEFTRSVYPVAFDGIVWTTRDELDASQHNIETDEGKKAVWEALANLNPPHCAANSRADGCFDKIVGFTPARANTYPNGTNQGYTFGSPANIVVASDEDAAATVAHEIAHNYGIGDAYNGGSYACAANPTPNEFSGTDFDTQEPVQCTAGRTALPGVGGTLVPAAHHPYEVGGRGALPDMAEFMGSGGSQSQFWASQDAYDWIFDRLLPAPSAAASQASRGIRTTAAGDEGQRLLELSGFIRRNATSAADLDLDAWQSFLGGGVADTTGPLMVAAVDAAGQRLATTALSVDFDLPGGKGEPAQRLTEAPFEGVIRFPAGTTAFHLINGGTRLLEVPVSPNAPVVTNVSLGVGSVFNGVTSMSWTGFDADANPLRYTVEYNPDVTAAHNYFGVLVADIQDAQWTEDFADLAGGDHARIRITATDGINAASAESQEFRVPFKAPDVAIRPLVQSVVREGASVVLNADVEDLQDSELPDASLVWTSDVSGRLGTGEILVVRNLAPGQHIITLTATNSAGLSASESIPVTILATPR